MPTPDLNVLKTLKGYKFYDEYIKYHADGTKLKNCIFEIDNDNGTLTIEVGEAICRAPKGYKWRKNDPNDPDNDLVSIKPDDEICNHRSRDRAGLASHLHKLHQLDAYDHDENGAKKNISGFKALAGKEGERLNKYYKAIVEPTNAADGGQSSQTNQDYDEGEGEIEIPKYISNSSKKGKSKAAHVKGELNIRKMLLEVKKASGVSPCLECEKVLEPTCLNRQSKKCKAWKLFDGGIVARRAYTQNSDQA